MTKDDFKEYLHAKYPEVAKTIDPDDNFIQALRTVCNHFNVPEPDMTLDVNEGLDIVYKDIESIEVNKSMPEHVTGLGLTYDSMAVILSALLTTRQLFIDNDDKDDETVGKLTRLALDISDTLKCRESVEMIMEGALPVEEAKEKG